MTGGLIGGAIAGQAGGQSGCAIGPCGDEWVAVLAALGGVVGAVSGGLIGEFTRTDKWEEVPVRRLRVSLAPQGDGQLGVGLSVAF